MKSVDVESLAVLATSVQHIVVESLTLLLEVEVVVKLVVGAQVSEDVSVASKIVVVLGGASLSLPLHVYSM